MHENYLSVGLSIYISICSDVWSLDISQEVRVYLLLFIHFSSDFALTHFSPLTLSLSLSTFHPSSLSNSLIPVLTFYRAPSPHTHSIHLSVVHLPCHLPAGDQNISGSRTPFHCPLLPSPLLNLTNFSYIF